MQFFRFLHKGRPSSQSAKTITNARSGKQSDDG